MRQTLFILHRLEWYKICSLGHKQDQNIHHIFWNESNFALAWTEKHLPCVWKTSIYGQNMAVRAGLVYDIWHTLRAISYHISKVGLHFIDCCFQAFDLQPSALLSHSLSLFLPPGLLFFLPYLVFTPFPSPHLPPLSFLVLFHCWECQTCNPYWWPLREVINSVMRDSRSNTGW